MTDKLQPSGSRKTLFILAFILLYLPFAVKYGYRFSTHQFIDLPSFHFAAKAAFADNFSPYDYERLTNQYPEEHVFPFLYPPPTLILFYPFSVLDYNESSGLMLGVSHISFLLSFFLMLRIFRISFDEVLAFFFCIYIFAFQPLYLTLALGQVNLVLLFLIVLFWVLYIHDKRDVIIAIPVALAIVLKTYPALFLIYFLLVKRYRLLGWTGLYLLSLMMVSLFLLPKGTWSDWIVRVLPTGGVGEIPYKLFNPAAPWNQSVNGFVSRLFLPNDFSTPFYASVALTKLAGYTAIAFILGSMIFVLWKSRERVSEIDRNYQIGFILIVMYLVAPLSWEHHIVYLLPCIMLLYQDFASYKVNLFYLILIVSSVILAKDFALESGAFKNGIGVLAVSIKFYAVVALGFLFVWRMNQMKASLIKPK